VLEKPGSPGSGLRHGVGIHVHIDFVVVVAQNIGVQRHLAFPLLRGRRGVLIDTFYILFSLFWNRAQSITVIQAGPKHIGTS
jgi:hypothetical protein